MIPSEAQPAATTSYSLRWWDAGFVATLTTMGIVGGLVLWSDDAPSIWPHAASVWGVLALIGVWYLVLGRAALRRAGLNLPSRSGDAVFLAGLILLMGLATYAVDTYATLQAIGYPLIWTVARQYRSAVLLSAALAVSIALGFVEYGMAFLHEGGAWGAIAVATLSFVFAVAMGTWITRIHDQGERHRALAEALRRSQSEVAALSESAGASAERERLSRELHDTLTQTLTGLVMLSEQADRALAADDIAGAQDRLARVRSAARESLSEARALVATTQPLGDGGLELAIERTAARLRADTGLEVTCDIAPLELDRERQVMLLRATQEGLSNARKHARASAAKVSLTRAGDGSIVLMVDDDGVGPSATDASSDAAIASGYGLTGLADRIRGIGGEVRFGAGPKSGARLEVRLPAVRLAAVQGAAARLNEREGER
ncbi:sensor histidine kinase [Leucobacter sp. NPDC058333]|uniref:sensor histidine kinase n=1 Tax=Leucobacter sp. NPDC058333 TaxID=3346450 RepID=UPI0036586DA1